MYTIVDQIVTELVETYFSYFHFISDYPLDILMWKNYQT